MINHVGRTIWASLLAGALGLFAGVPVASAWEWYLGGFVGGAFPQNTDFQLTKPQQQELTFPGPPPLIFSQPPYSVEVKSQLEPSLMGGGKAGVCPRFFPYLCAELEFDYFQPDMEGQNPFQTPFSGVADAFRRLPLARFDFRVYDLGLNLIGRMAILKEAGYPLGGRLHLYLGAGPSFIWTTAKDKDCVSGLEITSQPSEGGILLLPVLNPSRCNQTNTDFSVGVQALAGGKFFLTKHVALFSEYKFKHWRSDFVFQSGGGGYQIGDVDFNVHLVYVGLAFHF